MVAESEKARKVSDLTLTVILVQLSLIFSFISVR
jgi:hypothetical protein